MTTSVETALPKRLRESRLKNYQTEQAAARAVNYVKDTISRHEKGKSTLRTDQVIHYAKSYNSSDLLMHYCLECPINKLLRKDLPEVVFPQNVIQFNLQLEEIKACVPVLLKIASNGKVDSSEREPFFKALQPIMEFDAIIDALKMHALKIGVFEPFEQSGDRQ